MIVVFLGIDYPKGCREILIVHLSVYHDHWEDIQNY